MDPEVLTRKPLVEAIFEIRWNLPTNDSGAQFDLNYKLGLGRVFEQLQKRYPHHQPLPASSLPDEFSPYKVQHQFRTCEGGWPLVQLGPGVATLNDTQSYTWPDFKARADNLLSVLSKTYWNSGTKPVLKNVQLRYIDSIPFDFEHDNIFDFLANNLKTSISIEPQLFDLTKVGNHPITLDMRLTFPSVEPTGVLHVRFVRGQSDGVDKLVWETHVQSLGDDAPDDASALGRWLDQAHAVSHNWFYEAVRGALMERFR